MIEWKPEFSVGVVALDDQHKELFKLLDDLTGALDKHVAADIDFALTKLHVYVLFHFSSEEHLLAKYGYANFEEHVGEHLKFKSKVEEFKRQYTESRPELAVRIRDYLYEWIGEHILQVDKQYAAFLASRVKQ